MKEFKTRRRINRTLEKAPRRLGRVRLVSCVRRWLSDWQAAEAALDNSVWGTKLREERRSAAETRRALEEIIRRLQRQLAQHGVIAGVPVPPPEPQVLLIHSISARSVPQADEMKPKPGRKSQADNTSDPYARFVLMDAGPGVRSRETAFTSYLQNISDPRWDGERLQLMLTPGGDRPLMLRAEMCAEITASNPHCSPLAPPPPSLCPHLHSRSRPHPRSRPDPPPQLPPRPNPPPLSPPPPPPQLHPNLYQVGQGHVHA